MEKNDSVIMTEQPDIAIEVKDVCISYRLLPNITMKHSVFEEKGGHEVFEAVKNVSFSVREGEILGIVGENGSGKSTLLRSIGGIFSPNSGSIDLKGHSVSLMALGIGFKDTLSGRENIILSGMLLGFSEKEIMQRMDEIIEFSELGEFIDMPLRTYSSGMHSKLAFSITALLESDIILIDEVFSVGDERFGRKSFAKMQELISDKKHTVIMVSHNIRMMLKICNEVLWLHEGRVREIGRPMSVLKHYYFFMTE